MSSTRSGPTGDNRATFQPLPNPTTNLQGDEIKPLSGKPYYHVVLSKTHLSTRYVMGPSNNLFSKLPSHAVPAVLNYRGKSWDMMYNGQNTPPKRFTSDGWRNFADDNCLKVGDACIFELMENSKEKIIFEVQILRGDIPSKFLENEMIFGQNAEVPIVID
ncbi:B3 domain-containing protein Os04g0386900-like isoform X2 [Gastrolobium bilobum]|uniref:B3 domain-containing protein Os04g0386900-like isoform X2 n=1 Tax=Gastrolobium bilobum TaxID=150636 RepID=UPI002AB1D28A|nr:B3 domain-containing protein Os04g0386900-like isoform X2 [Gastrolobium bilobum]